MSSLKRDKTFEYTFRDHTIPNSQPMDGKLYVDICDGVDMIPKECKTSKRAAVIFISNDKSFCKVLMSSDELENDYTVKDKEKPLDGFQIVKTGNKFKVEIKCDPDALKPTYNMLDNGLEISSKGSCGKYNEAGRFFDKNKEITCLFLIGIGCVLLFLGGYQWDLLMTFIGFAIGFCIAFIIFWTVVDFKETGVMYFLLFIVACGLGGGTAWAFNQYSYIGEMIIGFFLGYALAGYFMFFFEKYLNDVGLLVFTGCSSVGCVVWICLPGHHRRGLCSHCLLFICWGFDGYLSHRLHVQFGG